MGKVVDNTQNDNNVTNNNNQQQNNQQQEQPSNNQEQQSNSNSQTEIETKPTVPSDKSDNSEIANEKNPML